MATSKDAGRAKGASITTKAMSATPDPHKDIWLNEALKRGYGAFIGRITPQGDRSFYFRYSGSKGQVRLPIGRFSASGDGALAYTVAQARDKAKEWSVMYHGGLVDLREHFAAQEAALNVSAEIELKRLEAEKLAAAEKAEAARLAAERRITVRQLFERWAATELKPHTRTDGSHTGRKDGGAYVRQQFERRLFLKLGNTAAADVKKSDVQAILDAAKADGRLRTANILLAAMKQMFRFALAREVVDRNPLDLITKREAGGKDVDRERFLTADEIKSLVVQLPKANMSERGIHALWIILSTGCRIGELMGAQWQHVNTVGRTWHLPQTKNGRNHTIHLSDFALKHFMALEDASLKDKRRDGHGKPLPWVFPNKKGTGPLDVKTFAKQLSDRQREPDKKMNRRANATKALELPGGRWTPHDLRRTTATMMAQLGVSGDVIDEALNHVIECRVRRTYIRDRRAADQAKAFDALGARLAALMDGTDCASNVVTLRAA
jgi:integrase